MKSHLVYLHIEKAAGSAQRTYFYNTIGKNNVYWHRVPVSSNQLKKSMYDFFLIGGHEAYPFYNDKELLYTTVTRNPIHRVLSFYNYCKEVIPNSWVPLGLDIHSLKKTIKSCKQFRLNIKNAQCRYISGSERFDDVINIILKKSFLIGCLENINLFNSYIARNLELYYKDLPLNNTGKRGYVNDIELDEECLIEIEKLIGEDIKLYKFISEDCKGLYSSVSDKRWSLAKTALIELRSNSKLLLSTKDSIRMQAVGSARFVLLAVNFDEQATVRHAQTLGFELEFSIARAMEKLEIGIHIYDSCNRKVFDTNSTMLGKTLSDIKCGTYQVRYSLVAELPEGQYTVGFTFTECKANQYYQIKRYDGVITFSVTVTRLMPSVGYASLPCEFDYQQVSDVMTSLVEDAAGTVVTDGMRGELTTREIFNLSVQLKNTSTRAWTNHYSYPINLSYHWLDQLGNIVVFEGKRTTLPVQEILSGQTLTIQMQVIAPAVPGQYRLVLLPVQEKHCWFDKCGFTPGVLEFGVIAPSAVMHYQGADA